jgi:hypothetical protein
MAIAAFNSFTDGLDPVRRRREHFIANIQPMSAFMARIRP